MALMISSSRHVPEKCRNKIFNDSLKKIFFYQCIKEIMCSKTMWDMPGYAIIIVMQWL